MPARSLEDCLRGDGANPALARLSAHAARLLQLQRLLEAALPLQLARGARIANCRLGKAFLHADNAAVAAKLRQIAPTLVNVFCNAGAEVTGIEVRVQPAVRARAEVRRNVVPPGTQAQRSLARLADTLPDDSPLRAALQRLARRGQVRLD